MAEQFFDKPILNGPYDIPSRQWELDADRQPTNRILESRRRSDLITPVPKPKKRRQNREPAGGGIQASFVLGADDGLSTNEQEYRLSERMTDVREAYVKSLTFGSLFDRKCLSRGTNLVLIGIELLASGGFKKFMKNHERANSEISSQLNIQTAERRRKAGDS